MNKLTESKINKLILKNIYSVLNEFDTSKWAKNSNGYIPRPQNLDDYEIPDEIKRAATDIARNAHEGWAANKMNNGYRYGTETNDANKTHADLMPYDELSDEKKQYDYTTAMGAVKLLLKLGYKIIPPTNTNESNSLTETKLKRLIRKNVKRALNEYYGYRYNNCMKDAQLSSGVDLYDLVHYIKNGDEDMALKSLKKLRYYLSQNTKSLFRDYNTPNTEEFELGEPQLQITFNYLDQAKDCLEKGNMKCALNYINSLIENNHKQ